MAAVTVIAAYDAGRGRSRAVIETDAGGIALAEGRLDLGEPGKALFDPVSLAEARRFAELVITGDGHALAHPKGPMMLAATLVAVLETLCREEKTDGQDA